MLLIFFYSLFFLPFLFEGTNSDDQKRKKRSTRSTNRNVRGESRERWPSQSVRQLLAGWFSAGRRGCPRQAFLFPSFIPCFLPFGSLPLRRTFLRHAHFPPTYYTCMEVGGCRVSSRSLHTLKPSPCAAKPGVICYDPRPPSTFPPFIRFSPLGLFQG